MKNITRVWIGDPYDGGHFNGTAFFVDEHTLVTAKHVVQKSSGEVHKDVFLTNTPDGGVTPVFEVQLCDRDMALLKVKKEFHINAVSFSNELSLDDQVNIRGYYDKQSSQKSYSNRVSGYQSSEHTFELQNHLTQGLSGSPVFLEGDICGVTKAINTSKNLTYVIPISELCMEIKFSDEEVNVEKKQEKIVSSLSLSQRVFNSIYSVVIPFSVLLVLLTLTAKFMFPRLELVDYIYSLIFIAFVSAKIFEFVQKKFKKAK
jgi:hypothetical protein